MFACHNKKKYKKIADNSSTSQCLQRNELKYEPRFINYTLHNNINKANVSAIVLCNNNEVSASRVRTVVHGDDVQAVEQLPLVLVDPLHVHVEHGRRVDPHPVLLLQVLRKLHLVVLSHARKDTDTNTHTDPVKIYSHTVRMYQHKHIHVYTHTHTHT